MHDFCNVLQSPTLSSFCSLPSLALSPWSRRCGSSTTAILPLVSSLVSRARDRHITGLATQPRVCHIQPHPACRFACFHQACGDYNDRDTCERWGDKPEDIPVEEWCVAVHVCAFVCMWLQDGVSCSFKTHVVMLLLPQARDGWAVCPGHDDCVAVLPVLAVHMLLLPEPHRALQWSMGLREGRGANRERGRVCVCVGVDGSLRARVSTCLLTPCRQHLDLCFVY